MVTAPQWISEEINEVSKRLEIFKKLNNLAIYWGAAPSDFGGVSGIDYRIIWRARKDLRTIVDRLGQLYKGEDIPAEVLAKIDKLETWSQEDSVTDRIFCSAEQGYWVFLLQIDLHHFEFDQCLKSTSR